MSVSERAVSPRQSLWPRERYYSLMALVLILGLAWIVASRVPLEQRLPPETEAPHPGFLAPDFQLSTLEGETIRLSDLRGRPVIINFWATWCPPCRAEMPAFVREYKRYKDEGLVILAVNQAESPAQVIPFRQKYGITFPILMDERQQVAGLYRIRALPSTYFVDPFGTIQDMVIGGMNEATVRARVQHLMEGQ